MGGVVATAAGVWVEKECRDKRLSPTQTYKLVAGWPASLWFGNAACVVWVLCCLLRISKRWKRALARWNGFEMGRLERL